MTATIYKPSKQERDRAETREQLRKLLKPGDTVYTVLRHVARSGMSRRIDLYKLTNNGPIFLSGHVADVLLQKQWDKDGSITVHGCGMDMGFHLVHSLSYAIHGHDDKEVKASIKALGWNPKHDGHADKRAGYTLCQRWL